MSKDECGISVDLGKLFGNVKESLRERGVDISGLDGLFEDVKVGGAGVRVVCVAPGLKDTVEEMAQTLRDQVVMVRVDEKTCANLDAWVETGAVKSRSEAAALFMREGLKVRAAELEAMREALREVQDARARLKEKAREVFGPDR